MMQSEMIDSHCHLADEQFAKDLPQVIDRAAAQGVRHMITIADNLVESDKCLKIAEKFDQIYCTVGVHPHGSSQWSAASGQQLVSLATASQKVKAIGEIGLDYHYDFSPRDAQKTAFTEQLLIARELGLPVVVHNRESIGDLKNIIKENPPPNMVLHCCTEKWEDVESLVSEGYYLSFTGMATYPKLAWIRETIAQCPMERIMIETDAPYLAPQSKRGKRNEPAFVAEVLALVAEIKGISIEEADRITTENTVKFFAL